MANTFKIGVVRDVDDPDGAERVKVAVMCCDDGTSEMDPNKDINDIPWSYPLMPKLSHIKPKVGEKVLVFFIDSDETQSDRYYLGPINSQIDKINGETLTALNANSTGIGYLYKSPYDFEETEGCFADNDEVALYGRKNGELILGNDYASLRSNARRLVPIPQEGMPHVKFNQTNPAYVTLHANDMESTATIVADKINLLGNHGEGVTHPTDKQGGDMISTEKMEEILTKAHRLPYGDELVDFLKTFVSAFANHVHAYPGKEPDRSYEVKNIIDKAARLDDDILSDNVRIN